MHTDHNDIAQGGTMKQKRENKSAPFFPFICLYIVSLWPLTLHAANFDCAKAATQVEQVICKNENLFELDGLLAKAYSAALSKQGDPDALKIQQRAWLRDTRNLCKDATCLLKAYTSRLVALSGACEFFGKYRGAEKWDELRSLNVDNQLGEVCNPKYSLTLCFEPRVTVDALSDMGLPSDDRVLKELLHGRSLLSASLVDIDNDGVDDLRLYLTGGTAHCTSTNIFKKSSEGKFKPVLSGGYEVLREEGRFCGGSDLLFVRHDGTLYTIERSIERFHRVDTVWIGSANHLYELCR